MGTNPPWNVHNIKYTEVQYHMHVQLDHGCKSDWEKHLKTKNITRSASGRPSQQVKGNSTQIRAAAVHDMVQWFGPPTLPSMSHITAPQGSGQAWGVSPHLCHGFPHHRPHQQTTRGPAQAAARHAGGSLGLGAHTSLVGQVTPIQRVTFFFLLSMFYLPAHPKVLSEKFE